MGWMRKKKTSAKLFVFTLGCFFFVISSDNIRCRCHDCRRTERSRPQTAERSAFQLRNLHVLIRALLSQYPGRAANTHFVWSWHPLLWFYFIVDYNPLVLSVLTDTLRRCGVILIFPTVFSRQCKSKQTKTSYLCGDRWFSSAWVGPESWVLRVFGGKKSKFVGLMLVIKCL